MPKNAEKRRAQDVFSDSEESEAEAPVTKKSKKAVGGPAKYATISPASRPFSHLFFA